MTAGREVRCPIGATVVLDQLDGNPHGVFCRLRPTEPVSWVPALGGWLVTGRELVVEMMRDATTYTVDGPRGSTGQVLGPSMLSLDGAEHTRHREPFAEAFRLPEVRRRFAKQVERLARSAGRRLRAAGRAEVRRQLAGPFTVEVMIVALGLAGAEPDEVLGWYREIVAAVSERSIDPTSTAPLPQALDDLDEQVGAAISHGKGVLAEASGSLTDAEVTSNAGVLLFGGSRPAKGSDQSVRPSARRRRRLGAVGGRPGVGRQCDRGVASPGTGGIPDRPLRHSPGRRRRGPDRAWRSGRALARRGKPRPGDVQRP